MLNWKLRVKNRTTLITLLTALVALVYQILGALGIVPAVTQDTVIGLSLIHISRKQGAGGGTRRRVAVRRHPH